ncbi:hypothetical protein JOF36_007818 [Pseudonocardia parietis]|uniref:Uncharacterized protein n=1 Tax=Pseudonocardia parietis TaxID=570936 RepID=A0ABS4W757_9PSEU|nr:hypothetical protein [Pseudonocardia parietis]
MVLDTEMGVGRGGGLGVSMPEQISDDMYLDTAAQQGELPPLRRSLRRLVPS